VVEALRERGRLDRARLAAAAGLSLGEYSALVFAGALEFEDAVRLTRARGQYMLDASRRAPSGMLSLVGGTAEQAEALVERGRGRGVLVVANRNAPGQLVLSGAVAALDEAARIAPELGIRRTVRLKVSGAFHSPLMEPAAERLRADLARVTIRRPEFPVVANASARPLTDPEEIRASLAAQVASPVLFEASLRALFASGVRRFVEPAPGRVLAGLVGRTLPEVEVVGFETAAALAAA
jgi:[acyl-carrier-protein] S-malonyltransferase